MVSRHSPGVGVSRYFMSERVDDGRVCVARLTRDLSRETCSLDALGLRPQTRSHIASSAIAVQSIDGNATRMIDTAIFRAIDEVQRELLRTRIVDALRPAQQQPRPLILMARFDHVSLFARHQRPVGR